MKITKEQARQQIQVYGDLLQERAVISEIEQETVRGELRYTFTILDTKYPLNVECNSTKELATCLSALWSTYLKVFREVGLTLDYSSI